MMNTFKVIVVEEMDEKIETQLKDITVNDLSQGEVVIKVVYSSLNYKDMLGVQKMVRSLEIIQ